MRAAALSLLAGINQKPQLQFARLQILKSVFKQVQSTKPSTTRRLNTRSF